MACSKKTCYLICQSSFNIYKLKNRLHSHNKVKGAQKIVMTLTMSQICRFLSACKLNFLRMKNTPSANKPNNYSKWSSFIIK